jgi:hypothetical protein
MSQKPIRVSRLMAGKKEKNREKLADRYVGKKALLEEWEEFPELDPDYLRDLRRRVRGHHMDLAYRGMDGFNETNGEE